MPTKCRPFSRSAASRRRVSPNREVAGVDGHVARLHERGQLVDHGVGRLAVVDHEQRDARLLQGGDEASMDSEG